MSLINLARAYAGVFAFMHLAAYILGLRIAGVNEVLNALIFAFFIASCFVGFVWKNLAVRAFFEFGWSVSVMVEWMHIITWVPAWSGLQYTVMAVLNMGMALSLGYVTLEEECP